MVPIVSRPTVALHVINIHRVSACHCRTPILDEEHCYRVLVQDEAHCYRVLVQDEAHCYRMLVQDEVHCCCSVLTSYRREYALDESIVHSSLVDTLPFIRKDLKAQEHA